MVWLAPTEEMKAMLPQMVALVAEHFPDTDPRWIRITKLAAELEGKSGHEISDTDRAFLAETVSLARRLLRKETLRVRSFVRIVKVVTTGLLLAAIAVAILAFNWPGMVPLCFTPENNGMFEVICPTGSLNTKEEPTVKQIARTANSQDYFVIEIVGVVSAAIAAAATLRRIRGTALPYDVPVVLAALKLPTGALTAVLGLLLMRGGFIPGLSALDSTAQIIAWAIVFGYSQQLFTKFVDTQGQALLDAVRGPNSVQPTPEGRQAS
ncbi:hypothetical protein DKG71_00195 [Streptomyces sp. NEAU-S7GS2]|nr:hypothetical protein DKG71_00195 [Streptomyces sp. NEAU-S7GS2]